MHLYKIRFGIKFFIKLEDTVLKILFQLSYMDFDFEEDIIGFNGLNNEPRPKHIKIDDAHIEKVNFQS